MDRTQIPGGASPGCAPDARAAGTGPIRWALRPGPAAGRGPGGLGCDHSGPAGRRSWRLFERTVPTGVKRHRYRPHWSDGGVEVTTFRRGGGYADGRHPDAVRFDAGVTET